MCVKIKECAKRKIAKIKKFNPRVVSVLVFLFVLTIAISNFIITNKDVFYATTMGAFLGFLLAAILYRASLYLENKAKDAAKRENTNYIYELYKEELEMNKNHINDLIEKRWIPYYKLKTITRDKLWGKLADYSKNIELMRKLNYAYGEFELINNKIDLMIAARLANIEKSKINKSNELEQEKLEQLEGAIGLGNNVLPVINKCLDVLKKAIEN